MNGNQEEKLDREPVLVKRFSEGERARIEWKSLEELRALTGDLDVQMVEVRGQGEDRGEFLARVGAEEEAAR